MDAPLVEDQNKRNACDRKKLLLVALAVILVVIIAILAVFWNKIFG
jgi:hypothetical protein